METNNFLFKTYFFNSRVRTAMKLYEGGLGLHLLGVSASSLAAPPRDPLSLSRTAIKKKQGFPYILT